MHVVIASGYHTGSHAQWAEGYADASVHDVSIVSLPGQFWQWRLTGGFVDLAAGIVERHPGGMHAATGRLAGDQDFGRGRALQYRPRAEWQLRCANPAAIDLRQ